MGNSKTLGGERLGSGNKQKVYLHGYERSTHDMTQKLKTTMSAGTLVPFLREVGLPGDSFDISLNSDIMTLPTNGPLFGSFKAQYDVFVVPFRLYQANLHMNALNIGMNMAKIKLPQIRVRGNGLDLTRPIDNQQINSSCILKYLDIAGLGNGYGAVEEGNEVYRDFEAISLLGYWDIYKNYYANKQEEIGYVIHNNLGVLQEMIEEVTFKDRDGSHTLDVDNDLGVPTTPIGVLISGNAGGTVVNEIHVRLELPSDDFNPEKFMIWIKYLHPEFQNGEEGEWVSGDKLFKDWTVSASGYGITGRGITTRDGRTGYVYAQIGAYAYNTGITLEAEVEPRLEEFDLVDIDEMRKQVLQHFSNDPFYVNEYELKPYKFLDHSEAIPNSTRRMRSILSAQEGLGIKTYQSDLFNNWMNTEWLDGENGINEITAISTANGQITIDEINLSNKIYNMLNRIAVSGGTYDDWLDAVYDHKKSRTIENPMYVGGLSKELVFQEVLSNTATTEQPLGTIAGKGTFNGKHKGGKIKIKIDEPSMIIGIVSLTPRIDYGQGNKWDVNLKTMDDLHKPALSQIGFQELITDQMHWADTNIDANNGEILFKSAGKQPAYVNYTTAVNKLRGNLAEELSQAWMVLGRRYEIEENGENEQSMKTQIKDLTTYVDPKKYNYVFANARRDAQNFWIIIESKITARRKMSARVMPNL